MLNRRFTAIADWMPAEVPVDVSLAGPDGGALWQRTVAAPASWSARAVLIAANKYMRPSETSVAGMIARVVGPIVRWGIEDGYFARGEAQIFHDELAAILISQRAAFNSPVWFNVGHDQKPQCSACFILKVEDTMASLLKWNRDEGMIFKLGSGSGTNLSRVRSKHESLSGKGKASGPLSFMKGADAWAGAIKSGGKTRRAAKMVILNVDHPDIEDFIQCKVIEEKKARALMAAGFSGGLDGEAYQTVSFQNANNSVGIFDRFMEAAANHRPWSTTLRLSGETFRTYPDASILLADVAAAAWECGDPGLFFIDTINKWHTCPDAGPINSSNPCQPGVATVLTPEGICTFDDVAVGDTIWSGERWAKVIRKVATGTKPVYRYVTRAGVFLGTVNHRVVSKGEKIEVQLAETIDRVTGNAPERFDHVPQAVMDGLVIGDGSAIKANGGANYYPVLHIGVDDSCYFLSEVRNLIDDHSYDGEAWRVTTTIAVDELPRTFMRCVPDRYFRGSLATVASFLRGLYSANGSAHSSRVTLKSASLVLIEQVQQMLSALGIRSYYTLNREHEVEHKNGVYRSRESYDLNITTDRPLFARLIGFLHPYKQKALLDALDKAEIRPWKAKNSFEILGREHVGDLPVFDITVDAPEHTYWTGGLLVSNCGEYLHLDETACNLASLNLLKFVEFSHTRTRPRPHFLLEDFQYVINIMITAMDILAGHSSYPTPAIEANAHRYRELGLGYSNLGALLMTLGLPYDSDDGRTVAASITALLGGQAYQRSAQLGKHLGPAEGLEPEAMHRVLSQHLEACEQVTLSPSAELFAGPILDEAACAWRTAVRAAHEMRNTQTTVIAPTGTISFLMDCDTTGIEPAPALVADKQLVGGGTLHLELQCVQQALTNLGYTVDEVPPEHMPVFATAFGSSNVLSPEAHIRMVAACQPFISGGISKTINLPESATVADIVRAYTLAWKLGLKAVSVYRDNSKGVQVISAGSAVVGAETEYLARNGSAEVGAETISDEYGSAEVGAETGRRSQNGSAVVGAETAQAASTTFLTARPLGPYRRRLPDERASRTHKFEIAGYEGYLTVGLYEDDQPGEVFVTMSKQGSTIAGLLDSWAIAVSLSLQHGVPLKALVDKYKFTRFEPSGYTKHEAVRYASSIPDYIARWLEYRFLNGSAGVRAETFRAGANGSAEVGAETNTIGLGSAEVGVETNHLRLLDGHPCRCGALMYRQGTCYACAQCGETEGSC